MGAVEGQEGCCSAGRCCGQSAPSSKFVLHSSASVWSNASGLPEPDVSNAKNSTSSPVAEAPSNLQQDVKLRRARAKPAQANNEVPEVAVDGAGPAPAVHPRQVSLLELVILREEYRDGSTYEGQHREGKRHGEGVWTSPRQGRYEGEWADDARHGHGRQWWGEAAAEAGECADETPVEYIGQFRHGVFHGEGRMQWRGPLGPSVYKGQYDKDLKHGTGRYEWGDGRIYEGQWRHGKRHGLATVTAVDGTTSSAFFEYDRFVRRAD